MSLPRVAPPSDRAPVRSDRPGVAGALVRQWPVIAITLATALGFGVLVTALSPVHYTASTSILLDPRLGKIVGVDPSTPGFVADSSAIDSQVKLLTSQTVLARVATMLHLDQDPEFSGRRFSLMRLLGLSSPSETGADLKALESAISIKRPERTYLVEIQVSAGTGAQAAAIANAIADAYNDDQVSSRVVSARNDAKFVAQKREQLRRDLETAERRLESYKSANGIVATDGLRSNEQQVADLTRELGTSRGRLSDLKAHADQIAAVARSGKLDSAGEALKSPTIERLRATQADTERELAKLAETLGPRHPARLEAQAQVARVRDLIGAELGRLRQSASNDYQTEKRNEAQLGAELDRLKKQSNDVSSRLVPLRQMEREVEALRASDERFQRIGDTLTQQEGDTPPARVVAAARPPVSPSWPRRSLILGVAGGVGLFLGLGLALLRDGLRMPVRAAASEEDPVTAAGDYWNDAPSAESSAARSAPHPAPVVEPGEPEILDEHDYYRSLRARQRSGRRLVWS